MRERFVAVGQFSTESGYQMMEQLIQALGDELPTALFMASDALAVGASSVPSGAPNRSS